MNSIRVGFEIPSGNPVDVPQQHVAVYGLTQKAGKTTLLEGMVSRVATTTLVLRTGRADIPFAGAHRVRPFFRERYDWKYVEGLLWSFLEEKPKVYRTWVMRATQGARSLADVHARIIKSAKKATRGWDQDLLFQLDHYFQEILPGLASLRLSTELELLADKPNVMDLEGIRSSVQQLIVAAVLDQLMSHPRPVVVVLPEARDFIPSDRSTPAKLAADQFVRRGAKLELYLWIDSQSLTGVDQQVLRNFGLSLHGRQTSDLEISRIVKAVGNGVTAADVKSLRLGEFLLEDQDGVRRVYAQPAWLGDGAAMTVARGRTRVEAVLHLKPEIKEETKVEDKERKDYDDKIAELEHDLRGAGQAIADLRDTLAEAERRAEANARAAAANAVEKIHAMPRVHNIRSVPEAIVPSLPDGVERVKVDLHVAHETPDLTVHVRVVRREASTEDPSGRAAFLVAQGFFDQRRSVNEACAEFRQRGWGDWKGGSGWNNMDRMLGKLASEGFLRNVEKGYVVVPEARKRIRVKEEAA